MVFAVRASSPLARTTRSAAATISSLVNLFFGAIAFLLSLCASFDVHHVMYINHYTRSRTSCQQENIRCGAGQKKTVAETPDFGYTDPDTSDSYYLQKGEYI